MVLHLVLPVALAVAGATESLRVPTGFSVAEFAGRDLADDIHCMTIDPQGRVVVAGRGYIRVLVDDDANGRADRVLDFAAEPKDGCMGLLVEGDALYFTGDGGLRRLIDADRDGRADGPSELLVPMKTGGEHDTHAMRRGPDGWLYVIAGNQAGINRAFATSSASPIIDPTAGCLVRFSPDFTKSEIVADGFRNPYDFDFGASGEIFTFDSDNERCVSLPWYEPTRFYRVRPGGHHGWLNPQYTEWWRLPPYFFDVEPPVCTLGRGSPTGVAAYRHTSFPASYRGGFFLADWTFGVVHFVRPEEAEPGGRAVPEVFLRPVATEGFAPTDLAVHPTTGDLYISIGGRGTRGGVYRVAYQQGETNVSPAPGAAQPSSRAEPDRRPHPSQLLLLGEAPSGRPRELLEAALRRLEAQGTTTEDRLIGVRLAQLALGDIGSPRRRGNVWEGYSPRIDPPTIPPRERARLARSLRHDWAAADPRLLRELARTLAMLEDDAPESLALVAGLLTATSDPIDDIHFLIVASRLRAVRTPEATAAIAQSLLSLDERLDARNANRDHHWPLRITELHQHLARKDQRLNPALLASPEFGRPEHVALTHAPGLDRRQAARLVLRRAEHAAGFRWTGDLVALIDELPADESLPVLRSLWGVAGMDDALLPILARSPIPADRAIFLTGLGSSQPEIILACLDALGRLPAVSTDGDDGEEVVALVRVLRSLGGSGHQETAASQQAAQRLHDLTGKELGQNAPAWSRWLEETHPDWFARLDGAAGPTWKRRLGSIDWSLGDTGRGRAFFVRKACGSCHSGSGALGPDLAGVAGRMSREDLFHAIVEPSRDVPARYTAVAISTHDGRIHQGTIVYEAADGLILRTGAATTVRIAGRDIDSRRSTSVSTMPAGLLDDATDGDLADLDAYLRSLVPPRAADQ